MKYAVIFDFDGVIIDSRELQRKALYESYKIILGEGKPCFEEFMSHSGNSLPNIFRKMNLPLEMIDVYKKISRHNLSEIKIVPGIKELLVKLTSFNINCGICTGKDRIRTIEILQYFNLLKYFNTIVCSDDVKNPKPSADSILLILQNLKIKQENFIMVGDAVNDILCAKNAGVTSIAVTWGVTAKEKLQEVAPDYIVSRINELDSCIQKRFLVTQESKIHNGY